MRIIADQGNRYFNFAKIYLRKPQFLALLILAIATPVTFFLTLQRQDLRQRAAELPITQPVTPPEPLNPVSWKTGSAEITASDFYIEINGQKFYANPNNVAIHSDPADNTLPDYTTLEATWQENGVEMRMNVYFTYSSDKLWRISEIRTYNAQNPSNWIYYSTQTAQGNTFENFPGQYSYRDGISEFMPMIASNNSLIHFRNLKITAFTDRLTTPTPTVKVPTSGVLPKAPSNLKRSSISSSGAQLTWKDNSLNEVNFEVMIKRTDVASGSSRLARVPKNSIQYIHKDILPGAGYQYSVRACNASECSAYSNTVTLTIPTTAPSKPSLPRISVVDRSSATLQWADNATNETRYGVGIKPSSQTQLVYTYISANSTKYRFTNLTPNTSYTVSVASCIRLVCSANAKSVTFTTKP